MLARERASGDGLDRILLDDCFPPGLHVTVYNGIHVTMQNDTDCGMVIARCDRVLTERQINGPAIAITLSATEIVLRIGVTAPCAWNNVLPLQFFGIL